MTRIIFEVPSEVIGDFTEKLTELELTNSIVGLNEDDEIEIEVVYEKNEADLVHELEVFLDELKELPEEEHLEEGEDED